MRWWRCPCLPLFPLPLGHKIWEGQLWGGERLPLAASASASKSRGERGGTANNRCRVTRQARKKGFRSYWGLLLTVKDSQVTRCHLLCWDNLYINQSPLGVNIWWENVPGRGVCSVLCPVWICGLKRKIKAGRETSEQEQGGSEGGQGFLNLLKTPLSNVLWCVILFGGRGFSLF